MSQNISLLTDMYELTMADGYLLEGRKDQQACFEYFFRSLHTSARKPRAFNPCGAVTRSYLE